MKQVLALLLEGSLLSPVLATVLGAIFGLLTYVSLSAQPLQPTIHWAIAIIVALIAAGGINLFLKPGHPISSSHD